LTGRWPRSIIATKQGSIEEASMARRVVTFTQTTNDNGTHWECLLVHPERRVYVEARGHYRGYAVDHEGEYMVPVQGKEWKSGSHCGNGTDALAGALSWLSEIGD